MTTLTEFLLDRIAEDEALARKAQQGRWKIWGFDVLADVDGTSSVATAIPVADVHGIRVDRPDGSWSLLTWNSNHIARWDPARVLAECEAKRRIVEVHQYVLNTLMAGVTCSSCWTEDNGATGPDVWPCETLRALAAVYASHPDYQQEWAL